jgi:hypothetical protein
MPFVERVNGVVNGVYQNLQPGYAEEFLADDDAEVVAFLNPPPPPIEPYLNNGGLARFSGSSPVVTYETIRMSAVTRVSRGRYRVFHEDPYPSDQYAAIPAVFDASPRTIRITARTTAFVEVRVTDLAGAVQDPQEVTVKTERVVT